MWCVSWVLLCLFFKQKTAYEMRISDWSSDVCSSDLVSARRARAGRISRQTLGPPQDPRHARDRDRAGWTPRSPRRSGIAGADCCADRHHAGHPLCSRSDYIDERPEERSEEHTSELQSLMRTSYAVFCLKKTNTRRVY